MSREMRVTLVIGLPSRNSELLVPSQHMTIFAIRGLGGEAMLLLWVNAAPLSCYSIGQDSRGGKVGPDIMNAYRSTYIV
jgi:hypothetical protein